MAENVKLNTAPNNNPVVAPVIPPLLPAPMPVMNATRPEPAPRQTITQLANAMINGLNVTSINVSIIHELWVLAVQYNLKRRVYCSTHKQMTRMRI